MTAKEQTDRLFDSYKANMDRSAALEDKPFCAPDRDSLLSALRERSVGMREMFSENAQIIRQLFELEAEPDADTAAAFFDNINDMRVDRYDDPTLVLSLIDRLLPYYEERGDRDSLILLYNRRAWETTAMVRLGGEPENHPALERYLDIVQYRDEYARIADAAVRSKIIIAYYNIAVVLPTMGLVSLEDSYRYYCEMKTLWARADVQALDGGNERLNGLMEQALIGWLAVECQIHTATDEMKRVFAKLAFEAYGHELTRIHGTDAEMNADVYLAHVHAQVLRGDMGWDEAVNTVLNYYYDRLNRIELKRGGERGEFDIDEEFYLRTRIPDALIYQWLDEEGISAEVRSSCRRSLIQDKMDYLASVPANMYSPFINQTFANWGFGSFVYLDTPNEKEDHLINLVVRRHINTYIHSLMVQRLADRLQRAVWEDDPARFTGVLGCTSKRELAAHREEIGEYIRSSALFHDIGKNRIAGIINIQTRKLNDDEFNMIRSHPNVGAQVLHNDPDFARYYDIICGHHKFYNGQGGYPDDFDNTASPVRFLIDIITMCDCIDAATDTLGRNYAGGKDFPTVLTELEEGAGVRYNPYLTALIRRDADLACDLAALTTTGREDIYVYVYQRYARPLLT